MATISERYRWHAESEFRGSSELYFDWAYGIAEDDEVLQLIERLPDVKRRAPLLFAAMRYVGAPLEAYEAVRPWLLDAWEKVEAVARVRSQQTNEAARCATLLPVLASIEGPIALIEVGAAAGACLFPDRYSYVYVTDTGDELPLQPSDATAGVTLRCRVDSAPRAPSRLPQVVWRAGIDVNPLSFANPSDVEWLRTLIWPEHEDRRERLEQVAAVVSRNPPRIERGDATANLSLLAADAPKEATLVVFHSAVLAYFSSVERERFVEAVTALDAEWISNEGLAVLPTVAAKVDPLIDVGSRFVVALNGEPLALSGPHGDSFDWLSTRVRVSGAFASQ